MPKGLVIGTIVGLVVLIALMSWLSNRSLDQSDEVTNNAAVAEIPASQQTSPQPVAPPAAGQPVVLAATAPVWLQVSERGGATLFSGMLQPGQTYAVPATATAPVLKTGKPEALQVRVGNQVAPPVGPAATTVNNVSLLAADLMKAGAAPAPAPAAVSPPAPTQPRSAQRPRPRAAAPAATSPSPEPAPAETAPSPTTNAQ